MTHHGGSDCGATAQHHAAFRHVIELHHAVRDHQRMVIRQAGDARAKADVARALDGGADEHFRGRDGLPAGGMMLADPGLVVAQLVDPPDQLHVARHAERRVLADPVEGCEKDAEAHAAHVSSELVPCAAPVRAAPPTRG